MKQTSSTKPISDDAPKLKAGDLARAKLRVGMQDVSREEFSAALNTQLGKQRVSIMLDGSIIAFFKAKAGERGYQTLINQALHQAMTGEQIESTLRRVIREELHSA
jgi:uncharacterized protein (DUF4415 family)